MKKLILAILFIMQRLTVAMILVIQDMAKLDSRIVRGIKLIPQKL